MQPFENSVVGTSEYTFFHIAVWTVKTEAYENDDAFLVTCPIQLISSTYRRNVPKSQVVNKHKTEMTEVQASYSRAVQGRKCFQPVQCGWPTFGKRLKTITWMRSVFKQKRLSLNMTSADAVSQTRGMETGFDTLSVTFQRTDHAEQDTPTPLLRGGA